MESELKKLELRLIAHRVLLAGILTDAMLSKEALQALQKRVNNEGLVAGLRARYPDAADAFLDEMQQLLQLSGMRGASGDGACPTV